MNSTILAAAIPSDVVRLTGPFLVGQFINWGLFGLLNIQVYLYYIAFPHDRLVPKTIVATSYIVELVQIIMSTRDAFRIFGKGWGVQEELDKVGWQWFSVVILGAIIASIGQMFYAWRIWVLSTKLWMPLIVVVLSLTQLVAGFVGGAIAKERGDSLMQVTAFVPISIWLVGTSVCDICIAASMLWHLRRPNSRFRSTNTLLTKIITVTIETGLICAASALIDLALFIAFRHTNYHIPFCASLSKLYSNSLLAVLNARIKITGGRNEFSMPDDSSLSTMLSTASSVPSRSSSMLPRFDRMSLGISMGHKSEKSASESSSTIPISMMSNGYRVASPPPPPRSYPAVTVVHTVS
ncbi:hypothetical protein C8Q75DRAFT_803792 [Abortiporus biennis]|nr:hypothetical protein C8Q75DRAFT_803792 [Abortiporus biennis]